MPRARPSATSCSPSTRRTARPCPMTCARRSSRCWSIIAAQGLPLLRVAGVEADDVIGTLACRAAQRRAVGADLHRRQGHGAAGERLHHAHQHHEQLAAGPRRRQGQVRCLPRADHRLPRPDRRQLGQHSRHRQGGSEDRREAAAAVRQPRWPDRPRRRDPRQGGREPARRDLRRSSCRGDSPPFSTDLELPLSVEELAPRRTGPRRAARAVHALRTARAAAPARGRRRRHARRRGKPQRTARRGRRRRPT